MSVVSASGSTETREVLALLQQAEARLGTLGEEFAATAKELDGLSERLQAGRFHLAVVGQFKRGKSTLLNALLGEELLPVSVIPLTALPTFIQYGPKPTAKVSFRNEKQPPVEVEGDKAALPELLAKYATEAGNPHNQRGVACVEITHPAPILKAGVVLIDTPGIGSTYKHNTEATLNFLPQCDAALFLVSADPPITEVEVEFLKEAHSKVARLFFVLNKVDYLDAGEREEAADFLKQVLVKQAGLAAEPVIYCISARRGLQARLAGDEAGWRNSGMAEVEQRLIQFLAEEKAATLCKAVRQKTVTVLGEARLQLQLTLRSLQLPLEELKQRLGEFEQQVKEVKLQQQSAVDLLAGDRKRMLAYLEELAEGLRQEARKHLVDVVRRLEQTAPEAFTEAKAREALAEALPGFFEHKTGEITELVAKRMTEVLSLHQERLEALIERLRRSAADLFEVDYHAPEASKAFQRLAKPYWETHNWSSLFSPLSSAAFERFLPARKRRQRLVKRIHEQIILLVQHNVELFRWPLYQNINDSFRRFGALVEARLAETLDATHGAISLALQQRETQGQRVAGKLAQLESALAELSELMAQLSA